MLNVHQRLLYAAANTCAVLAALFIALWADLDRPYWAMFTVFIVSKPVSGAVRSKSVYRLVGTLLGASMSVFLVPPLVQSPVLLSLAMSLWIGACLFAALRDRTSRSYTFVLAAYSVAIVGLPTVNTPTAVFDVAVARIEEIATGIACATVAHSIFSPHSLGDVLRHKAEAAIRHSAAIVADALRPGATGPDAAEIATAGGFVADLHTLSSQIGFETSNVPRLPEVMAALLDRLATLVPQASLVQRALARLEADGQLSLRLKSLLADAAAAALRIADGQGQLAGADPFILIPALEAWLEQRSEMVSAVGHLAVDRTRAMLVALTESRELAFALHRAAPGVRIATARAGRRPLYSDNGLALRSAGSATAATLAACALWIASAWPEGFIAAQFAAIACCLFATLDDPSKVIGQAVVGVIIAVAIAIVYEFAILPAAYGFEALALVLAPVLLLFSFLQTFEQLEGLAVVLAVGFAGAVALRDAYAADLASFLNANLAEVCGLLIAIAILLVFRTIDPVWHARRILRSSRLTLQSLVHSRGSASRVWALQMCDRIGLAAMRLHRRPLPGGGHDILRDFRVGLNIAALLSVRDHFDAAAKSRIDETLGQIGTVYARDGAGPEFQTPPELHDRLAALSAILHQLAPSPAQREGSIAVAGLCLDLDPQNRPAHVTEECAA